MPRNDSTGSYVAAIAAVVLIVRALVGAVDWHAISAAATSGAGLCLAVGAVLVGCGLVSAVAPRRPRRVRRRHRPIIGQPAYWGVTA